MIRQFLSAALLVVLAGILPGGAAWAQSPDYFVPNQPRPAAPPPAARPTRPQPPRPPVTAQPSGGADEQAQLPPQVQLPPVPDIPALPRGPSPPASVIAVFGLQDVTRASTAAQQVGKTIGERREKLNEDAQKEQATLHELEQSLVNDRAKLSPEQLRGREHDLQDRITKAQREFRDRASIIQQAAQYGQAQIERALVAIVQRVAESRGVNLVLRRDLVVLNVNEFDITEPVLEQLNKALPSVVIPPDGVSPLAFQQAQPGPAQPAAAPAPAPAKK